VTEKFRADVKAMAGEFSGSVRDSKSPILVSSVRRRGASDK
jgi:hypothetical protein